MISFLPADSVGRLPLVSRAQRDAQPRVLFAAARERGVAGELALACVETLRGPDRNLVHHHFRETWSDGISERWLPHGVQGAPARVVLDRCTAALVGTPPRLELQRTHGDGHGGCLCYRLRSNDYMLRPGTVSRLRVQMSAPESGSGAQFNFLLCGPIHDDQHIDDDYLNLNPLVGLQLIRDVGHIRGEKLRWEGMKIYPWMAPGEGALFSELSSSCCLVDEAHPTEPVMWYTVDAVFPYDSSAVFVSVNGGPYKRIGCRRSRDVRTIQLYPSLTGGIARYGDIEVWYSQDATRRDSDSESDDEDY